MFANQRINGLGIAVCKRCKDDPNIRGQKMDAVFDQPNAHNARPWNKHRAPEGSLPDSFGSKPRGDDLVGMPEKPDLDKERSHRSRPRESVRASS